MLAVLSLLGFIAMNEPAPAKDADAPTRELAQVFEQARHDFEVHHAELGLLGAAPLAGREPSKASSAAIPTPETESSGTAATTETPAEAAVQKRATVH